MLTFLFKQLLQAPVELKSQKACASHHRGLTHPFVTKNINTFLRRTGSLELVFNKLPDWHQGPVLANLTSSFFSESSSDGGCRQIDASSYSHRWNRKSSAKVLSSKQLGTHCSGSEVWRKETCRDKLLFSKCRLNIETWYHLHLS